MTRCAAVVTPRGTEVSHCHARKHDSGAWRVRGDLKHAVTDGY